MMITTNTETGLLYEVKKLRMMNYWVMITLAVSARP